MSFRRAVDSTGAYEWSAMTMTACASRNASMPPAGCMSRSSWRSAAAAAVHQVGGAGGAHAGVVEDLEHRPHALRQMGAVHVVDGVGELAHQPEAPRRAEARPVLDVALLGARVPVHRGDVVLVLPG